MGDLINKPNRLTWRGARRTLTICNVEKLSARTCADLIEIAARTAEAIALIEQVAAEDTVAGIEQLAADCVRDRQLFPDGELQSWVDGYWKPAVDRLPDLARFKGLYVATVKRLAIEELGALMLKVNAAAAAKEGGR